MDAWDSLVTGWNGFWEHRGAAGVAGINFLVNMVVALLMSLAGIPVFHLPSYPSFGQPVVSPQHLFATGFQSLTFMGLAVVMTLVIGPFIRAATPGSLIDAATEKFSITSYFKQGARYFWRAFGLMWLNVVVMIGVMAVSALIVFLLSLLFGLILGKAGTFVGVILGILLLIIPWMCIFVAYMITMLKYVTSRERGLGEAISEAVSVVREKFWPTLGVCLIFAVLSIMAVALAIILSRIPVIGMLISMYVSSVINVIGIMVLMAFAGLLPVGQ